MIDFTIEIKLQTTRSGGAGGQNVNKVETAVIAYLDIHASQLISHEQKLRVIEKLANRMNKEGQLIVKSQTHRTQLSNRAEAVGKVNELIAAALKKKRIRIGTKPSKKAKEKRLENKKLSSQKKEGRKRFDTRNL